MKKYNKISVLLVDGSDRQTLPIVRELNKLGCKITTLNSSRLDNGYASRYPNEKIIDKSIRDNKYKHLLAIKKLVKTGKYDVVITTSDDTAEILSLSKEELEKDTRIAVNPPNLFFKAYDKLQTMKICTENNIPCPKTYPSIQNIDSFPVSSLQFPIVIKPRKSFGAIGYRKFDNDLEFIKYCKSLGDDIDKFVVQEYIPQTDIQYECAMLLDEKGTVKTSLVFSKNRWFPINGGSSTCNVTVDRKDIIDICTKLLKEINWVGPADIDLIQDPRDNIAKVIEINPRVSGSVKIVICSGVNIVEQILQLLLGIEVSEFLNYRKGVKLRCIHTDFLWFLKSPNRFKSKPNWFDFRHTYDQIWSIKDPLPFFTFSIQSVLKYKREMAKRRS